ncbi:ribonuclease H-like domain-containing protein [Pisolithus sp. B1]|nr:ribonuclease H-like domain-containing protein [Pisolithus sp. B1]
MSDPLTPFLPWNPLFPASAVFLAVVFVWRWSRAQKLPAEVSKAKSIKPCQPQEIHPKPSSPEADMLAVPLYYQPQIQPISDRPRLPTAVPHIVSKELSHWTAQIEAARVKQPYDAFLVLDVEATCLQGAGFDWPNEIIEWPVCLLRWKDRSSKGMASQLEVVDEFRSFVKPTWRPQLSNFCTELTGITQTQVNLAPTFPMVLKMFARFLAQHGLIDPKNGRVLQRICWCSDGPFDIRDFVVKQCFISKIPMPLWLRGDVLDVRRLVSGWVATHDPFDGQQARTRLTTAHHFRSLNIPHQLRVLGLGQFQGREHCGMDDTRNIARVLVELARRGIRLVPNTPINPNRRWGWMGRPGEVLEYYFF